MFNDNNNYNQYLNNNIKTQIEIKNNQSNNNMSYNNMFNNNNMSYNNMFNNNNINYNNMFNNNNINYNNMFNNNNINYNNMFNNNNINCNNMFNNNNINYNDMFNSNYNNIVKVSNSDFKNYHESENIKDLPKKITSNEISNKKDLDEINEFFKDVYTYQENISDEVNILKNNITENEIEENYKKMKNSKINIREIMENFENKLEEELGAYIYEFDPTKVILESAIEDKLNNIYDKYEENYIQNFEENLKSENEKKLDEINNFFKNVDNYQKMITEIMKNLKNEIENEDKSEAYEKMKKTKKWLYYNIDDSEEKMNIKYTFDPAKIIHEISY